MSESHLTSLVSSSFVGIPVYELLHNDAAGTVPSVYICKDIETDQIACPTKNVLSICPANFNVYVVILYRPPSSYTEVENADLLPFLSR